MTETKTAQILDGKVAAAAIKAELTERVAALKAKGVSELNSASSANDSVQIGPDRR